MGGHTRGLGMHGVVVREQRHDGDRRMTRRG